MTDSVLFEEVSSNGQNAIGVILLNSEATLNAIDLQMTDQIMEQLISWQNNDRIVAIFIHSSGEKSFCPGGDIQQIYHSMVEQSASNCEYAEEFFIRFYRLVYFVHTYCKPTIVWGNGYAMGGGLGVLAGCKHRIATENTCIAMPEVRIGLFPDAGGSYFLNRMPGYCGRFLALTGISINATDSIYSGITDYFISTNKRFEILTALTKIDWQRDKNMDDTSIKQLLSSFQEQHKEQDQQNLPTAKLKSHRHIIDQLCQGDDVNMIIQRISNYITNDEWMIKAQKGLSKDSPLAIKWIFKQLQLTANCSLKQVFEKEMILATNIVHHGEFAEGIRALIIEKDQQPNWKFKSLDQVQDRDIDPLFQAPWASNPLFA